MEIWLPVLCALAGAALVWFAFAAPARGRAGRAEANLEALAPYVRRGVPVVGLEPSCVTPFRDDYLDLVPGERAEATAKQVKMIDEFLAKAWTSGQLDPKSSFRLRPESILLHGHCQQ